MEAPVIWPAPNRGRPRRRCADSHRHRDQAMCQFHGGQETSASLIRRLAVVTVTPTQYDNGFILGSTEPCLEWDKKDEVGRPSWSTEHTKNSLCHPTSHRTHRQTILDHAIRWRVALHCCDILRLAVTLLQVVLGRERRGCQGAANPHRLRLRIRPEAVRFAACSACFAALDCTASNSEFRSPSPCIVAAVSFSHSLLPEGPCRGSAA